MRRQMAKGFYVGMGVFVLGFPALFAASPLVPALSGRAFSVVVFGIFAVCLGAMIGFAISGERMMRRTGLVCPACRTGLVGVSGNDRRLHEHVLETGTCPKCGAQLLDPAEVGPVSKQMTPADHIRGVGMIVALLAGLGATSYFASAAINHRRAASCNRRYAAAHSAADSLAVDAHGLTKRGTVTCGDLRRNGRLRGGR